MGADAHTFVFVVGGVSQTPSLLLSRLNPKVVTVADVQPDPTLFAVHAFGTFASPAVIGTSGTSVSGPVQSAGFLQISRPLGPEPNLSLPLPPGENDTVRELGVSTVVRNTDPIEKSD